MTSTNTLLVCLDCGQTYDSSASSAGHAVPGTAETGSAPTGTAKAATGTVGPAAKDSIPTVANGAMAEFEDRFREQYGAKPRPHWMDCQSAAGLRRRIRSGLEPGYLPITFSRIKRWEQCAYGEQQENRIPDRVRSKTDKADLGTAIHLIQEAAAKGEAVDQEAITKLVPMDAQGDFEYLVRSAKQYVLEEKRPHALFVEDEARMWWEFPVTLKNGGQVIAQVEIKEDVLKIFTEESLAEVVDYKTGRVVDKSVDDDDQGMLACAVLSEQPMGQDIEWFDFIQPQLRFWKQAPTARWHRSVIEEFKVRFQQKVEAYANEQDFDTRPGNHCHWCPVAHRCPQGSKLLAHGIQAVSFKETVAPWIATDDDARNVAQIVIQMDAAVKQMNNWLREYVKQTEKNIDLGNGTTYGQQIKSTLRLPREAYDAARQILAEHDFNFDDYIRFDMQDGDGWKFIKGKRGPEAGLLKDLAQPESYTRWEVSKKEDA